MASLRLELLPQMASVTVPCPKASSFPRLGSTQQRSNQTHKISFARFGLQGTKRTQSTALQVQAKLNEVTAEKSSNSAAIDKKQDGSIGKLKSPSAVLDAASVSAFMAQVSDLVKLVDSKDITELQLKQMGCELVIRKKEALEPPPAAPAASFVMPPNFQHMMSAQPSPAAMAAPAPATSSSAPAPKPALPAPAKPSGSSHPPLKCPMAGTFYRCPGPGEPPFVKVGDKVQKGQVICIIEAMKLMNEIEADQSGTIAEVLVEDGKAVSVDMPLFVIAP